MTGYDQASGTSLKEAARRGTRWTVVQNGGSRVTSFLVFLILARLLTPEDFGVVALATVFVALLQLLVEGGFGQALIQRPNLERGHVDTVFWTSVTTGLLLAVGLALAADPLAAAFGEPLLGQILPVLAIALLVGALGSTQAAQLRRNLRFGPLAVRGIVSNVLAGVAGVALALAGAGVWALVAQFVVLNVVQTVLLWVAAAARPGLRVSRRHFLEIFAFSRNSVGNALLQFGNKRLGEVFIGVLLGAVPLGFYTVGNRLLVVVNDVVSQSLHGVAFPVFAKLQHDTARLRKAYEMVLKVGSALVMPIFLFFTVAATDVVQVLFGDKWLPAAPIMAILALTGAVHSTLRATDACLNAIGRADIVFRNRLLGMVAQLVAFVAVAPFGIVWVAWTVVARNYLLAPLPVWSLIRAGVVDFRTWLRSFGTPLLATTLMVGAVAAVRAAFPADSASAVRLAAMMATAAVTYCVALTLLDRALVVEIVQTALPRARKRSAKSARKAPTVADRGSELDDNAAPRDLTAARQEVDS